MDSPSKSALFGPNADVEFEEDCRRCDAQLCCRWPLPTPCAAADKCPARRRPCTAATAVLPLPTPCTTALHCSCAAAAANALHCPLLRCRFQRSALRPRQPSPIDEDPGRQSGCRRRPSSSTAFSLRQGEPIQDGAYIHRIPPLGHSSRGGD